MLTTVAIIGGGPAGLVSAKHALAYGLVPTVFEAAHRIGGVWRGDDSGLAWQGLPTYFSKYTCCFPDLPHDDAEPLFSNREGMQRYLQRYVSTFNLARHIHLRTKVVRVVRENPSIPSSKWVVTTADVASPDTVTTLTFDFVIFASGVFARPYMPSPSAALAVVTHPSMVSHTSSFSGEKFAKIAAARSALEVEARSDKPFDGLRVLVVGTSFSGCDIAVHLADGGADVTASFRKSSYLVPRLIGGVPMDAVFFRRTVESHLRATGRLPPDAPRPDYSDKHDLAFSVCHQWWTAQPVLAVRDAPKSEPPFITVSDSFLPHVSAGKIAVMPGGVDEIHVLPRQLDDGGDHPSNPSTHSVEVCMRDGRRERFDHVVLATGYTTEMSYVEPAVLETAGYKVGDLLQPFLLYKGTVHPDLPTAAFVGLYRGPFFAVMDLQAMWAMRLFTRATTLPDHDEIRRGLAMERERRHMEPRPQFPHGEYSSFLDELSVEAGCDVAAAANGDVARLVFDAPTFPQHFRLASNDPQTAEAALSIVRANIAAIAALAKTI